MFIARNQKDEIVNSLEGCLEKDSFWCLACEKRVGLKKGKKGCIIFITMLYHYVLTLMRESQKNI